jgi:molecular chaperone DnaK
VKTAMQRSPFLIKEGENQAPLIVTRAGEFAVPEISAIILDYARNLAAERLNTISANRAVVTVPASFNDAQRSATATAGQIANLEVVRVINEPTAAALAYGHQRSLNSVIAVYDFGGGTFDITILRLAQQVYEVLGTAGDTFLGGDDLDERIVDKMVAKFLAENRVDLRTNEVSMMRLRAVAEQTKIELSRRSRAVVRIDEIAYGPKGKPLDLNIEITRDEFVSQVSDIIDRTFPVCQEALALAGLGIDQIDDVILVGGTTKIPYVRDQVSRFFAKPPRTDVNPEDAVAVGAALQANALERQMPKPRASSSVGAFDNDQDTVERASPEIAADDDISAPTQVPSELATGAPRVKRPTAGLGSAIPPVKPDTSYKVTRGGTRDMVGPKAGTTPPPMQPLARMKAPGEVTPIPGPPPSPPQKITAPGMGAAQPQPPPVPSTKQKTQMVPVVPRPPAPPTPISGTPSVKPPPPSSATPPGAPSQRLPPPPAGLQPLPRPQPRPAPGAPLPPMPRTITGETNPSIAGEIDSNPGTGTFPGLLLPPQSQDSFADEDSLTLAPDANSSVTDATQIPGASDSFASEEPNMGTFTDFDTQERLVPPAPVPSPNRPVPAALPNARTMIAAQPQPPPPAPSPYPPRLSSDFEDEPSASVSVAPASTAKGMGAASNAPTLMQPPPQYAQQAPQYPQQAPQYPQQVPIMPAAAPTMAPMPSAPARPPVVLEVTPRGLGIGTVAGFCEELIRRNSRLPAAQKKMFTTSRDSQDLVRIVVCQGESRRMDNNTVIGDLILTNLPPRPRGETAIEVTFHLDASGILQVRARDAQTGHEQSASLDLVGGMAQQDVAASRDRLAQLRR